MIGDRARARRAGLSPAAAVPAGLGRGAARRCSSSARCSVLMRLADIAAPLGQALALFAGGWLVAQLLGHAGFPLAAARLRRGRGRARTARRCTRRSASASCSPARARPPTRSCRPSCTSRAGVHQGPLVITRREVLVGAPGAVVRGGIIVRANGVTIKNVSVVGGENGITVDGCPQHDARRCVGLGRRARRHSRQSVDRSTSTTAPSTCSATPSARASRSRTGWATG